MKNSTAADLAEMSLPISRILRIGIVFAFFSSSAFCLFGELTTSDFERSYHWFWIGAAGAFAMSYMIQWVIEGEIQRYREAGDES